LNTGLHWESPFHGNFNATVHPIEHFDARGMRRVYRRGDHLGRVFNMDIWEDRHDRILARFWSRNPEVDEESWEIIGVPDTKQIAGRFDGRVIERADKDAGPIGGAGMDRLSILVGYITPNGVR
jgi:hypothetical protein